MVKYPAQGVYYNTHTSYVLAGPACMVYMHSNATYIRGQPAWECTTYIPYIYSDNAQTLKFWHNKGYLDFNSLASAVLTKRVATCRTEVPGGRA